MVDPRKNLDLSPKLKTQARNRQLRFPKQALIQVNPLKRFIKVPLIRFRILIAIGQLQILVQYGLKID